MGRRLIGDDYSQPPPSAPSVGKSPQRSARSPRWPLKASSASKSEAAALSSQASGRGRNKNKISARAAPDLSIARGESPTRASASPARASVSPPRAGPVCKVAASSRDATPTRRSKDSVTLQLEHTKERHESVQVAVLRQLIGSEMRELIREELKRALPLRTDVRSDAKQRRKSMATMARGVAGQSTRVVAQDAARDAADQQVATRSMPMHLAHLSAESGRGGDLHLADEDDQEVGDVTVDDNDLIGIFGYQDRSQALLRETPVRCHRIVSWWIASMKKIGTEAAPIRHDPLSEFANGRWFQVIVYAVIVANCLFMAYSADLAVREYTVPQPTYVALGEMAFMFAYTVEILIRFWRDRWWFFFDESYLYNWMDLFLLAMMYYFNFTTSVRDVAYLRVIRMLRLMKVLRVFRLIAAFKTLRAILLSLANTMGILMWSMILLTVILFVFALVFVQSTAMYFQDQGSDVDPAHFESLSKVYGGMWTAFLSLFMCSTGGHDWIFCYEPIALTGAVNKVIFLFFVAFTQIAVMNIILGIFVDNAMKRMMIEKEEAAIEHAAQEHRNQEALIALCNELDKDKDGKITRSEWQAALNHAGVMSYLDLMGFHVHNVLEYYEVMSKNRNDVDIHTFVSGCMRLKGWATCYDMQVLLGEVKEILICVQEQKAEIQALLQDFSDSELSDEQGN